MAANMALSPWIILALILIGCGPLFAVDALAEIFPYLKSWTVSEGFGVPWCMGVALPSTVLAVIFTAIQVFRLPIDLASRLK